jgi:uncharacterized protein YjbI with pentapeptide repeats
MTGLPDLLPKSAVILESSHSLDSLRVSLTDAANVSTGLWFSYVFSALYLAIATSSVTHRDLLLENPIKLPFLGVDLPVVAFFVFGPLLFIIIHLYVLLHLSFLGQKTRLFQNELNQQIADPADRNRLRMQLPSNIFLQLLAGPREIRAGLTGVLLQAIALFSLVIGPVALLVLFVLQFLPFHSVPVSWWQRLLVVADISFLWLLWPQLGQMDEMEKKSNRLKRFANAGGIIASLIPLLLIFAIATIPNEWLELYVPDLHFIPTRPITPFGQPASSIVWLSLRDILIAGDVDLVSGQPTSVWSNRLVLPGVDLSDISTSSSKNREETSSTSNFSLRGRRLEGAVLLNARLRGVDLTAANLEGAFLSGADLKETKFGCEGVKVSSRISLFVLVQRRCTNLRFALLSNVQLQAATLEFVELQGADFSGAKLQGASLDRANLTAVQFVDADLRAASLKNASLEGASFLHADLRGASFAGSVLQGASFDNADVRGAFFKFAELQGSNFEAAKLQYASFDNSYVWRADIRKAVQGDVFVREITTRAISGQSGCAKRETDCRWSEASFEALVGSIKKWTRGDESFSLHQISPLDLAQDKDEQAKEMQWIALAKLSPSPDVYQDNLAKYLIRLGCDAAGPYVTRGLIRRLENESVLSQNQLTTLAKALLDDKCSGSSTLSELDRSRLRELGNPAIE